MNFPQCIENNSYIFVFFFLMNHYYYHDYLGRPSAGGLHFPEYVVYRGEQV